MHGSLRSVGRGWLVSDCLDFARPRDTGVVPGGAVGRKVGKAVEEGRLAAARFEFLQTVSDQAAVLPDTVAYLRTYPISALAILQRMRHVECSRYNISTDRQRRVG